MDETNNKPAEKLTDADKSSLDMSKMRLELAKTNVQLAAAQNQAAELAHQNLVLRLAFQYKLSEGDILEDNGEIIRKNA